MLDMYLRYDRVGKSSGVYRTKAKQGGTNVGANAYIVCIASGSRCGTSNTDCDIKLRSLSLREASAPSSFVQLTIVSKC